MNILERLPGIEKDVLLSGHTTFKIGGPAKYFFVAENREDVVNAVTAARESGLSLFILGGGSNLLVSDRGFGGLVIRPQISSLKFQDNTIIAGAGVSLSKLVTESVNNNLTGFEWAAGIPGTVGGAVVVNAGAYGRSMSDSVKTVIAVSANDGSCKEYENSDCGFVYRGSRFGGGGEIIVEIVLNLEKGNKEQILQKIKGIILERGGKNPPQPSAGSVFKNYRLKDSDPLIEQFPDWAEKIRSGKIAAGYLIEQCGLKGKQIGGAKIPEEHANFIVNLGGARAEDVVALIRLCQDGVKKRYNIVLEEEVRYLGF
ncbi:MAG: UDP-N-acetylenolpyruvoylglucosamine reductase [Candidatus Portnoybacteria bacterium CG09_land_8_20_14_0_10_44_13]|uniref:UDP-N-acetylenolpyruvoylglucosamine reductase n=1 Tax=Candidatus Portnoybacteria bacterium CG09_land_8_20_14_0_10_44_13 TaxID=1974811 RepID=A0A2H0WWZ2_9BACT|nr:MAG: UDP-N-acetylenolpyruvoylglucosamine reductase [Candidatus Portnoybacteria bacterium CG09_land_8_20_14_0_10_44_13]